MSVHSSRYGPSQQCPALPPAVRMSNREPARTRFQVEAEFGDVNVAAEVDC